MKKILFFGAGVLGSLYAARLKQAGQDVTILARNTRLKDIREHGIVLEHALTKTREVVAVPVVEHLDQSDCYDLIVVLVRKNQLAAVLPIVALHTATPHILFMINNPSGFVDLVKAVGAERLLLGFAGAGGTRIGHVVRYVVLSRLLQPTTFGKLDGSKSAVLNEILHIFSHAGFPTAYTPNIDAWQKTHVAWISPLANALYKVNCDNLLLARSPLVVQLAVRAVREGFNVLHALGIPITPTKLRMFELVPANLLQRFLMLWASTTHFRTVAVEHAAAATDEMQLIAKEFHTLALTTALATPAIDELRSCIPSSHQPVGNG